MKKTTAKIIFVKITSKIIAAAVFLASLPAVSAIPYRNAFEQMDIINQQTKELNLDLLARIQIVIDQSHFDMASYIPLTGLPQNDNGEAVVRHILKQTMKTIFESETAASAPGIRKLESLNSSLSTTIDRHGHSVSFRLKAVETVAEVNYKGYVSATLAYDVQESAATLEVSKNIGEQTYAYTHTNNTDGYSDVVGIRWNF